MAGAFFGTFTAAHALLVINGGKEVGHGNRIVLASTLAKSATDTKIAVDHCNAGLNADSVRGTNVCTVAAAHASESAFKLFSPQASCSL